MIDIFSRFFKYSNLGLTLLTVGLVNSGYIYISVITSLSSEKMGFTSLLRTTHPRLQVNCLKVHIGRYASSLLKLSLKVLTYS